MLFKFNIFYLSEIYSKYLYIIKIIKVQKIQLYIDSNTSLDNYIWADGCRGLWGWYQFGACYWIVPHCLWISLMTISRSVSSSVILSRFFLKSCFTLGRIVSLGSASGPGQMFRVWNGKTTCLSRSWGYTESVPDITLTYLACNFLRATTQPAHYSRAWTPTGRCYTWCDLSSGIKES